MTGAQNFEYLEGYEFSDVNVRAWNIIGFSAQKWDVTDPLEQRETAVFFYYPDEPPEDRWAVSTLGEATGIHGCAVFSPDERWVYIMDDGQVYVVGGGDDDWEAPIDDTSNLYFSNVRSIGNSKHAAAVGPKRTVYVRKSAGHWNKLDAGLFPAEGHSDLEHAGFDDICGFALDDMYACGGHGDVWRYDGRVWERLNVPTNAPLERMCASRDGYVYITIGSGDILVGRLNEWSIIEQSDTSEQLESIVDFNGTVILSSVSSLYLLREGRIEKWRSRLPELSAYSHLACGDGILAVAGRNDAAFFDGESWSELT